MGGWMCADRKLRMSGCCGDGWYNEATLEWNVELPGEFWVSGNVALVIQTG